MQVRLSFYINQFLLTFCSQVRAQLFAIRHNVQAVQVSTIQSRHILHEGDTAGEQGASRCALRHEDLPE